jgi:hypothetical protein
MKSLPAYMMGKYYQFLVTPDSQQNLDGEIC